MPKPRDLHAFMRALLVALDYDGILALLRWMATHQSALDSFALGLTDGRQKCRVILIATRAGLEHPNLFEGPSRYPEAEESSQMPEEPIAPQEVIAEAEQIVEKLEGWGGWPTDEEVEAYAPLLRKGQALTDEQGGS